jgi:DNA-binding NtrC family response regulator
MWVRLAPVIVYGHECARPAIGTNAMILLLGSEPVVRSVMKEALERAGFVVLATGSLGVALDTLATSKVELLITHPYVANITGHEAAKYLRSRNPKMGILIVAGLLVDDRLQYRADIEQFDVFPAPYTAAQLVEKVRQVMKTAKERAAHG